MELKEKPRAVDLGVLAAKSKEELAALGQKVNKVTSEDTQLQQAALVLRDSRRLYTLGRAAISRRLDELGYKPDSDIEPVLVEAMNHAAMQEFTRGEVAEAMQHLILPFLAFELAAEQAREEIVEKEVQTKEEEEHRQTRVPIGTTLYGSAPDSQLARGEVTIIVSRRDDVKAKLDEVAKFVPTLTGRRVACIRFVDTLKEHTVINRFEKEVLDVGVNRWLQCATTFNNLSSFLKGWMRQTYKSRLDLLLIDDISQAVREPVVGYPVERMAAAANKNLRRWAKENGCAVLAGLPLTADIELPTLDDAGFGWNELRQFARVLVVEPGYELTPKEVEQ